MKKYIFILLLFISYGSYSQTGFLFADSTAQWNVLSTNYTYAFYTTISYNTAIYNISGDTSINGLWYQKINISVNVKDFIRKDSTGKVFLKEDVNDEVMIYDFGAKAGDSYILQEPLYDPPMIAKILSVDTVILDKPRLRQTISFYGGPTSDSSKHYRCIEGIGILEDQFFYPGGIGEFYGGPVYQLLCFSQFNNLIYHDTVFHQCVIDSARSTNVDNIALNNLFQIDPNPATGNFINYRVQRNLSAPFIFKLFDITGREVMEQQMEQHSGEITVEGISKGLYLYEVFSENNKMAIGKMLLD